MSAAKINLREKLALFDELWTPKIVAELNGQEVRLAKVHGEFVWHTHEGEDELFLVLSGSLDIHLRDRVEHLEQGDLFVVPRGVEHRPVSEQGAELLLFEPASVAHTGDVVSELTVDDPERI